MQNAATKLAQPHSESLTANTKDNDNEENEDILKILSGPDAVCFVASGFVLPSCPLPTAAGLAVAGSTAGGGGSGSAGAPVRLLAQLASRGNQGFGEGVSAPAAQRGITWPLASPGRRSGG